MIIVLQLISSLLCIVFLNSSFVRVALSPMVRHSFKQCYVVQLNIKLYGEQEMTMNKNNWIFITLHKYLATVIANAVVS